MIESSHLGSPLHLISSHLISQLTNNSNNYNKPITSKR